MPENEPAIDTRSEASSAVATEIASRGRSLVTTVAVGLAILKTLLVYGMAWHGEFEGHYILVMLGLIWVYFVCYRLAQGRAWARWLVAISVALAIMFLVASVVEPPEGVGSLGRWYAVALFPLFGTGLYVLLFSDAAAAFFQTARRQQ
jgi:hypothetical protein